MAEINRGNVPTVIADDVHIVYRVNTGSAGKGSATAALSKIMRRGKGDAPGVRRVHAVRGVS
ncbi:teichoic acid ABC transporter ATP-binding protein, partial [Streptomyces sp. NRRL S-444]